MFAPEGNHPGPTQRAYKLWEDIKTPECMQGTRWGRQCELLLPWEKANPSVGLSLPKDLSALRKRCKKVGEIRCVPLGNLALGQTNLWSELYVVGKYCRANDRSTFQDTENLNCKSNYPKNGILSVLLPRIDIM